MAIEENQSHREGRLLFWTRCLLFLRSSPRSKTVAGQGADHEEGTGKIHGDPVAMPAGRKPGGWRTMPYIIGNDTFERLASTGMTANFTVYLVDHLHMKGMMAANLANVWFGTLSFVPLVGAFLSDAYLGCFLTLAIASVSSFLGMVGLTLTAAVPALRPPDCNPAPGAPASCGNGPSRSLLALLFASLGLLTVGAAGIRACSIPFGADQFDATTEKGRRDMKSFFQWYYFAVTAAMMVALTAVVYVQSSVSWALGFGIPAALMLVAVVLFFVGTRAYVYVRPEGSVFSGIIQVFVAAFRKRKLQLPSPSEEGKTGQGELYDPPLKKFVLTKLPLTQQFRFLNKAALVEDGELRPDGGGPVNPWRLCSVQQVEEVKRLIRIVPIWAAGIICYVSMAQQSTVTVLQALKMDRHLSPHFQVPPGSLSIISMLVLTLFVPLYDRVLVPAATRLTRREGGLTLLQRIGAGMAISVLAMVTAGVVEGKRRAAALRHGGPGGVSPLSVMWLAPQLALLGLAEALNVIGQIEFYYHEFPEHMHSLASSFGFLNFAVASYLSSAVMAVVRRRTGGRGGPSWLDDDINLGRVDYFYFLIAAMGAVNLAYFVVCARLYRYKGGEQGGGGREGGGGGAAV